MPNEYIRLSKEEFDNLKPINNNIIIECILPKDFEVRPSGLIMVKDYNLFVAKSKEGIEKVDQSAPLDRIGKVAKICDKLEVKKRISDSAWKLDWETTIEIKEDDIVAFDYHSGHHCPILQVEDKEYRVINYQNLIVAKRFFKTNPKTESFDIRMWIKKTGQFPKEGSFRIIPLNGYCLFTRKNVLKTSNLILSEEVDKSVGVVRYIGSRNVDYVNKAHYDDMDIKVGDEVSFRNKVEVLLEDKNHFHMFDEELRWAQRKEINAILN